jgi:uncharacterized protein (TIGR03083 family)
MDDAYWSGVTRMRLTIADLLDELAPEEWQHPSLCKGWRIRDVAGHVSLVPTITTGEMLRAAPRAGFDPNRINTLLARRYGDLPTADIVARLREHAANRTTAKVLDERDSLFDVVVHSQDIAVPLGRSVDVPVDLARRGLDRVWEMGWPFKARRRLAGLTLRATDTDWSVGSGPQVEGTALALLLVLTGRTRTAEPLLNGAGVAALAHRSARR